MRTKYDLYSECIAITEELLSFRVEVFHRGEHVGKANGVVNRTLDMIDIYGHGMWLSNDLEIQETIQTHCIERAKYIWQMTKKE